MSLPLTSSFEAPRNRLPVRTALVAVVALWLGMWIGDPDHVCEDGPVYTRLAAEQCATRSRQTVEVEHEATRAMLEARLLDVVSELYTCVDLVGVLATRAHMFTPAGDDLKVDE